MNYLTFMLVFVCVMVTYGAQSPKPHIIFILADDLGWGNVGYHNKNNTDVETPNINNLVSVGIELDRHYVYSLCSPSRSSFLSGRNPIHVNVRNLDFNYNPANNVSGYAGVPINMTMIAQKLRQGGYRTRFTGKWDAGFATKYHLPVNRGFETGLGYLQHGNDYWTFNNTCGWDLWQNNGPATSLLNPPGCSQAQQTGCTYEDDLFLSNVLREVSQHDASTPLFYYWAPHSAHLPIDEVPTSYLQKFSFIDDPYRRNYAATVNHMDDMIGQLVTKLKNKNMWSNTLLIFSADNGGPVYQGGGANNYPLKGGKASNLEGGIRAAAFMAGGFIPSNLRGTKSTDFITIADWYATFCSLAGVSPVDQSAIAADLPPIDSFNIWPLLSKQNTTNPRTEIPIARGGDANGGQGNGGIVQGIIVPPYKYIQGNLPDAYWTGPKYPNTSTNYAFQDTLVDHCATKGCLYNLIDDPTEHFDISSSNNAIVQNMKARIQSYTVFNVNRGDEDPKACKYFADNYGGFVGPWITPTF